MADLNALPHDDIFQLHFQSLPGPAYMWQRADENFVLVAHNRAAADLPFSRIEELVGKTALEIQSPHYALHADLDDCLSTGEVRRREIDFQYTTTGVVRPVALTVVPLSEDHAVLHTEDLAERRQTQVALEASERLYRTIVDNAHEGIWTLDLDCKTIYVNTRAAELLGYGPDELIGRPVFEFMFELDFERAREIRDRRHAGAREQFDFRFRHRDGSAVWVSAAGAPLEGADGTIVGSVTMMSDITQRIQTERALRASETRLRALLDSHPDTILRITREGRYLDAHISDRDDSTGWLKPEQLVGRNVADLFSPEFAAHHAFMRERALKTGKTQLWEYQRTIDGAPNDLEARFVPVNDSELLITIRNITQRKKLDRELALLAARFDALTAAAFDGVCISEDGRAVELSERFAAMLGYGPTEAIGKETGTIMTTPSLDTEIDHYLSDRPGPYPAFAYRKDGTVLSVEVCGAKIRHDEREVRIYAVRDIAVRRRLQQEIIDISEREQNRIGRDLHDGVGQTLTGVSLALSSLTQKLSRMDDSMRAAGEDITSTVQKAIGDVRRIAHTLAPNIIGTGGFVRTLERLGDEVNKYSALRCTIAIDRDCEIRDETVATHLYRIAQEAVHNAIRHSRANTLLLRCARRDSLLHLEVVDDGVGIAPAQERTDGTGMKNMRYRAEGLNGSLDVYRTIAGGTRLVCECPTQPSWFA